MKFKDLQKTQTITTENGAIGFKSSGSALVDFNFRIPYFRSAEEEEIQHEYAAVWEESPEYAIKYLFFLRDIRGGMGERRTFRICWQWLAQNHSKEVEHLIKQIPEYGRWDDVLCLLHTPLEDETVDIIGTQLAEDIFSMMANKPISLCAKWMPSVKTSSKATMTTAHYLNKKLCVTEKRYRKMLSQLREYLRIVESKMSANKWDDILYNQVPSKANLLYRNAFLLHDNDRRMEYLQKLAEGKTTIHSAAAFPYEIVHAISQYESYANDRDETIEAMWKALPNYIQSDKQVLVVADGSGSMCTEIGDTRYTASDVCCSLAIYFAEHMTGEFKNKFITFSGSPQLIDLSPYNTLFDKLKETWQHCECENTDIIATFKLILNTAAMNNYTQADMPDVVLCISDMEFDSGADYDATLFKTIGRLFVRSGYKMPKLVFWNVNSRTNIIPMQENENGVALLSGFSPILYNMVISAELSPYRVIIEQLDSERYKNITLSPEIIIK